MIPRFALLRSTVVCAVLLSLTRCEPDRIVDVQTQPAIELSESSGAFTAIAGGGNPVGRGVTITNGGAGTLSGLAATVTYPPGQPTGWLATNLLATTAPAVVTLLPAVGTLAPGTYGATVSISSPVALNSPRQIAVTFTVAPAPAAQPTISIPVNAVAISGVQGGPNPGNWVIHVTNGGGGTLTGLTVAVVYGAGDPGGWLTATLETATAPADLLLRTTLGSLPAGTYRATVSLVSPAASNSPRTIAVTLTVAPPVPAIALSSSSLAITAQAGGANPVPSVLTVTNSGGGTLSGLQATVVYTSGATGWLSATLNGTTAPASLTLGAALGTLPAGTYTATVAVSSPVANNSPRTVAVTLTVTGVAPTILLSATSRSFAAQSGGANPASQMVQVTNSGGGTLSGLAVTENPAVSWLAVTLTSTTAPATLTFQVNVAGLVAGTYSTSVVVSSPVAGNSPQAVSVTLTVAPAGPVIDLDAASISFRAVARGPDPSPDTVAVTNGGTGVLNGLTLTVLGNSWLSATLTATTAPAGIVVRVTLGTLSPGMYTGLVIVASPASTSGRDTLRVVLWVDDPPTIWLSPASLAFTATAGGASPVAQTVQVTNVGTGTISGLTVAISPAAAWLTATLSNTTAPATITVRATTGALAPGTYTAAVQVTSPTAINSPRSVPVTFTVAAPAPLLALSASSRAFSVTAGGANPPSQTVQVTNAGGGTLSGLATAENPAVSWLNVTLSSTTAPATLTFAVTTGTLAAGTYTTTVRVSSPVATNSPQDVAVTLTVSTALSAPSMQLPSVSGGVVTLTWTYPWSGLASSSDGYALEESTTSSTSGFSQVQFYASRTTPYSAQLTRPAGTYHYRVRAMTSQGYTPYSTVRSVTISASTAPTTLLIINDLPGGVIGGANWTQLNTVIRVRIGPTSASVINFTTQARELLFNGDQTSDVNQTLDIPPGAQRTLNVSSQPGAYWVYIQTGWWEYFAPSDLWVKHMAQVMACDGVNLAYKWVAFPVTAPFGAPEVIRLSDFLPAGSYGPPFCP